MSAPHLPDSGGPRENVLPLIGFIAVAGPPPFLLAGAAVLGALVLAGPFTVILTLVAALALVASVVAALVAAPFLLVRLVVRAIPAVRPVHLPRVSRTRAAVRSSVVS